MKAHFDDPIKPEPKKQKKKSPWDFRQPPYDERSSNSVDAGFHYGMAHKNPVGHEGSPKQRVPTMPFGRVKIDMDQTPKMDPGEQDYYE